MRIDRETLILVLLAAALTGGFVVGLWVPHRRDLSDKQQQLATVEALLAAKSAQASEPVAAAAAAPSTEETASKQQIALAIPTGAQLGPLLAQMGEDLEAGSVTDRQFQARAVVAGETFSRIPLSLRFQGTYDTLFQFLQRVESRQRIIRVDRLVVRRQDKDSNNTVVVDIELSTFFRPLPEDVS